MLQDLQHLRVVFVRLPRLPRVRLVRLPDEKVKRGEEHRDVGPHRHHALLREVAADLVNFGKVRDDELQNVKCMSAKCMSAKCMSAKCMSEMQ